MDSLSYQKLGMSGTSDTCVVNYNKAGLVSDLGKAVSGSKSGDFQKLMEKAQSSQPDSKVDQPAKTDRPAAAQKTEQTVSTQSKGEDALTRVKKLAEQGYALTQPNIGCIHIDLTTGETLGVYQPGEYVLAFKPEDVQVVPTAGMEPWQQLQLQQVLGESKAVDVSDPKADAMLEATAPGADNSLTALLEKVVNKQAGQTFQQAVEEGNPQQAGDDDEIVITDASQTNQYIFRDVKNVPVKVGEVYSQEPVDEADVVKQLTAQILESLQEGESVVRIQLTPEHLGIVTVEISQGSDGVLRISMSAHSSETRGLLERHASDLQGLIGSRTQQTVEINVQRQQESQQNQNQQNYDGHNGHGQQEQERRQQQQEQTSPENFMQQLRLGLIPEDGES